MIVTICGSMRFAEQMKEISLELEASHNMTVLQCTYNLTGRVLTEAELSGIRAAHRQKIDLSDAVYVVDLQGYIGEAVREEIAYAKRAGNLVFYHSEYNG